MMHAAARRSSSVRLSAQTKVDLFDKEVVPMPSTSPLRPISTCTGAGRGATFVSLSSPVISITLQADQRRVCNVADAAFVPGISRSKQYQVIAGSSPPRPS